MIVNYALWSHLISLVAIALLYPLRHITRSYWMSRIYASILLFPALASGIFLFKLTRKFDVDVGRQLVLAMTPITYSLRIADHNAHILVSALLCMSIFIFLLPLKNFVEHLAITSLSLLTLIVAATCGDLMIAISLIVVTSVLVIYLYVSDEHDNNMVRFLTKDFTVNRISDLLFFVAIFLILIGHSSTQIDTLIQKAIPLDTVVWLLIAGAVFLRTIFIVTMETLSRQSLPHVNVFIFHQAMMTVAYQILWCRLSSLHDTTNFSLIITACIVTAYSFVMMLFNIFRNGRRPTFGFVISLVTLALAFGRMPMAIVIICVTLIAYPLIFSFLFTRKIMLRPVAKTSEQPPQRLVMTMDFIYFRAPERMSYFIAHVFINFLNPIYGFLVYRLPQFAVGLLQSPLRFLNNGNVHRSLLFVGFMVAIYVYWWGNQ